MIIRRGTVSDVNWYVVKNQLGLTCAYLLVHDFNVSIFAVMEDVDEHLALHGGCTYLENKLPWDLDAEASSKDLVVGWDYGHAEDIAFDTNCRKKDQLLVTLVDDDEVVAEAEDAARQLADFIRTSKLMSSLL